MYVNISYDEDFTELMVHLKAKYGSRMFELDGIDGQLDINKFSREFFSPTAVADVSVDSNSNVSTKDTIVYNAELPKPYFRLNGYYLLWRKLRQLYGQSEANRIIEMQICGDIYINDAHSLHTAYCFNFSTYDIALEGLTMVNKIKSVAPKHLYSFKSQLEQFVTIASNSIAGACGLADLNIVMSYYIDKMLETKADAGFTFATEEDCWRYVKETLVSFIYTVNQPNRGGMQSPFTNVSIFDDGFLRSLLPDYKFADGRSPNIETVKRLQSLFIDTMNEELRRTPITFPVFSACFSVNDDNEILDRDFLHMIADKNTEFGFINIYCGKTSTLSSCCFTGDAGISYVTTSGTQYEARIKDVVSSFIDGLGELKVDSGMLVESLNIKSGETEPTKVTGVLAKQNEYGKLIRIKVGDNEVEVTPDHIFAARNKSTGGIEEVTAEYLCMNDKYKEYQLPVVN